MRATSLLAYVAPLAAVSATAVALAGCGDDGDGGAATTTTVIERTTEEEAPLSPGDCGDAPRLVIGGALDPATLELVPCDEPHQVEVGAVFDYPLGADGDFPGAISVDGYATEQCIERFEAYVGAPYLDSELDVLIIAPDEDGWDDGDRRVACVLYHTDFELLTGSVEASGR